METKIISGCRGENISVPVFPTGSSALMCKCGAVATTEEEVQAALYHFYLCEECDEPVMLGRESGIRQDALAYFDDAAVLSSSWWHATAKDDWYAGLMSNDEIPMVHLGTKVSALSRVLIMGRGSSNLSFSDWNLYQIKLTPEAKIAPRVVDDFNGDAPETVNQALRSASFESHGVTRYLNRYETVGSISLLANPLFFDILSIEPIVLDKNRIFSML